MRGIVPDWPVSKLPILSSSSEPRRLTNTEGGDGRLRSNARHTGVAIDEIYSVGVEIQIVELGEFNQNIGGSRSGASKRCGPFLDCNLRICRQLTQMLAKKLWCGVVGDPGQACISPSR